MGKHWCPTKQRTKKKKAAAIHQEVVHNDVFIGCGQPAISTLVADQTLFSFY